MIKDMYRLIDDIPHLSMNELIRLKWAADALALACRKEQRRRDEIGERDEADYEREEAADYRRRQARDDAAIDALEGKKSK